MSWTDKPNPEFEQWWATKTAEGYQYGREALENVRFGFEGAQEMRWQPIETAPRDLISDGYASKHGPRILAFPVRGIVAGVRWFQSKVTPEAVGFVSDWQEVCEPTLWMPLPDPSSFDQAG